MSDYLLSHGTRKTPQTEPMRSDQTENSAGGFVWAIDKWSRLNRFLILGSEGGSYYASERQLTKQNVTCIRECLTEDGVRLVNVVVDVSKNGRAPKNDPALYALATAISLGDRKTKSAAAEALPDVARIATHIYHFVAYAETMRGWGRTMRWAVSNWYEKNPEQLAYQAVKYRQRDGWSHRDLLRLAHPDARGADAAAVFGWIGGHESRDYPGGQRPPIIEGFERAQASASAKETAELVREYRLPREALLTEHLNDPQVWSAMLETGMPMHAMVRNLATMTRIGAFDSNEVKSIVIDALGSQEAIKRSRLHPLALLVAQRTYASGRGFRGSNTWTPKPDVIDALDESFYLAFDNVEATGKNTLLALDVSPSMAGGQVAGSPLSPREASVAMALVTLHVEKNVEVVAFAGHTIEPLGLSRRQRLDDAVRSVSNLRWSSTDCSLPFAWALAEKKRYESFAVYTDSETFAGRFHPKQALDAYRQMMGVQSRSAVVAMVSNGFSIADPNDAGMIDFVGLDTSAPAVMNDFFAGRI